MSTLATPHTHGYVNCPPYSGNCQFIDDSQRGDHLHILINCVSSNHSNKAAAFLRQFFAGSFLNDNQYYGYYFKAMQVGLPCSYSLFVTFRRMYDTGSVYWKGKFFDKYELRYKRCDAENKYSSYPKNCSITCYVPKWVVLVSKPIQQPFICCQCSSYIQ